MQEHIITDFLVRLGFDGDQVVRGVAKAEAALDRLRKLKSKGNLSGKEGELFQAIAATKEKIKAEQTIKKMKEATLRKESMGLRKEQADVKRLLRSKAALKRSDYFSIPGRFPQEQITPFKKKISAATNTEQVKNIRAEMKRVAYQNKVVTGEMAKQLTLGNMLGGLLGGWATSLKSLAKGWFGIAAAIGGVISGLKITQEFQALDASMLAVSDSAESAARNVKFLTDISQRLPVDLSRAADQFRSMLSSGRDVLGESGVKEVFTALSEYGAAIQADPERLSKAMRGVEQIFNKRQLMAEEVKNQVGENLAGAVPLLAKSLDMSVADLFKAMKKGELTAENTMLKFAKTLKEAARNNDALTKSLKTSRSQWQLLQNNLKLMFRGFGSSRLDKGVAGFIKLFHELLKILKPVAQMLFYLVGVVMDVAGIIGRAVTSVFQPWLSVLEGLKEPLNTLRDRLGWADDATVSWLGNLSKLLVLLNPFLRMIGLIGAAVEEVTNIFTGHAKGLLAGTGSTIAERLSNGFMAGWAAQIGDWWENTVLPWWRDKTAQLGEILRDALRDAISDLKSLVDIRGMAASTGSAVSNQVKAMFSSTAEGLKSLMPDPAPASNPHSFLTIPETIGQAISLTINTDISAPVERMIQLDKNQTIEAALE